MSPAGRFAALALAAALAIGAALLYQSGPDKGGPMVYMLGLQSALILIGTLFEARYRGRKSARRGQWEATGERELDHETGTVIEVWFDPVSGERRYVPAGHGPE